MRCGKNLWDPVGHRVLVVVEGVFDAGLLGRLLDRLYLAWRALEITLRRQAAHTATFLESLKLESRRSPTARSLRCMTRTLSACSGKRHAAYTPGAPVMQ